MKLQELGAWELLQKELTWQQLGEFEGKTILEFGCGNGVMGVHYAEHNTVVAVEPDGGRWRKIPMKTSGRSAAITAALRNFRTRRSTLSFVTTCWNTRRSGRRSCGSLSGC